MPDSSSWYCKMFHDTGSGLVSVAAHGRAQVMYPLDTWVTPPDWLLQRGYGLTVFSALKYALWFVNEVPSTLPVIYIVEVDEPLTLKPMIDLCSLAMGQVDKLFPASLWPRGTLMFGRIKLIEKIWDWRKDQNGRVPKDSCDLL